MGQPFIACVCEIVQQVGSMNHNNGQPDGILLQTVSHNETSNRLRMPHLILQEEWTFVPLLVRHIFTYELIPMVENHRMSHVQLIPNMTATVTSARPVVFVMFIRSVCALT